MRVVSLYLTVAASGRGLEALPTVESGVTALAAAEPSNIIHVVVPKPRAIEQQELYNYVPQQEDLPLPLPTTTPTPTPGGAEKVRCGLPTCPLSFCNVDYAIKTEEDSWLAYYDEKVIAALTLRSIARSREACFGTTTPLKRPDIIATASAAPTAAATPRRLAQPMA